MDLVFLVAGVYTLVVFSGLWVLEAGPDFAMAYAPAIRRAIPCCKPDGNPVNYWARVCVCDHERYRHMLVRVPSGLSQQDSHVLCHC
jgi:hypothetical protein